jgi:hypothetical protein
MRATYEQQLVEAQAREARLLSVIQKQNGELNAMKVLMDTPRCDHSQSIGNADVTIKSRNSPLISAIIGKKPTVIDIDDPLQALSSDDIMRGIQLSDPYI